MRTCLDFWSTCVCGICEPSRLQFPLHKPASAFSSCPVSRLSLPLSPTPLPCPHPSVRFPLICTDTSIGTDLESDSHSSQIQTCGETQHTDLTAVCDLSGVQTCIHLCALYIGCYAANRHAWDYQTTGKCSFSVLHCGACGQESEGDE